MNDGCPNGMYPMDSKYPNEVNTFEELVAEAEKSSDTLNFPISWYITEADEGYELEERKFEVVFLMGRKYGDTWSLYTHNFDSAEAEKWVKEFTKREATNWYGWDDE